MSRFWNNTRIRVRFPDGDVWAYVLEDNGSELVVQEEGTLRREVIGLRQVL